jgi:hypothetical protein
VARKETKPEKLIAATRSDENGFESVDRNIREHSRKTDIALRESIRPIRDRGAGMGRAR